MIEEKVTLTGYNSKKQPYIFLVGSVLALIMGILCLIFADINDKYGCILCFLCSVVFVGAFVVELKQPEVALKIINNKRIFFYNRDGEKVVYLHEVKKVYYWPWTMGLKITFITSDNKIHFTCLLSNSKEVKEYLLELFEQYDIKIIRRCDKGM